MLNICITYAFSSQAMFSGLSISTSENIKKARNPTKRETKKSILSAFETVRGAEIITLQINHIIFENSMFAFDLMEIRSQCILLHWSK